MAAIERNMSISSLYRLVAFLVHNNKHPPTQKKFEDQAMIIKFQWNFLSLKSKKLLDLKIKKNHAVLQIEVLQLFSSNKEIKWHQWTNTFSTSKDLRYLFNILKN